MNKERIKELRTKYVSPYAHICCDEYHSHRRSCVSYDNEQAKEWDEVLFDLEDSLGAIGAIRNITEKLTP